MWAELAQVGARLIASSSTPPDYYKDAGLQHPGVDQARLRSDPVYAEAAQRALRDHIAHFGTGWQVGNSNPANVARDIASYVPGVQAEMSSLSSQGGSVMEGRDVLRILVNAGASALGAPQVIPDVGPIGGGFGGVTATPAAFPIAAAGATGGRALLSMLGVGGAVAAGGRLISTAIGMLSRKKVVALAKSMGIQGAATALGIGAVEVAQMWMDDATKKRRGKGVTAAQIKVTRRTMRTVMGLHKQIVNACSSAGAVRRRTIVVNKGRCK